ncbi:hypothetical protein KHM83_18800 [Fusibacter paucivorans]|uniref:Core-binding (CB) domain-containing protein n=1 Tax=Fusibacter paucivorans TaxID=76009 RepID=A0ABS5PVJ3_9FIRM|nr:hypothetical protein [Fusibacter paucivorans]MBS7528721.1 hypothetical protein [Fusibacter paucivorans]
MKKKPVVIEQNKKLVEDFRESMVQSNLSEKTVNKHTENVSLYINEFLSYYAPKSAAEGIENIDEFFSDWLVRKVLWISPTFYKDCITGIKKFYRFLLDREIINADQFNGLNETIKENKAEWLSIVSDEMAFDDGLDDDFFFGGDVEQLIKKHFGDMEPEEILTDDAYFFDEGMLADHEADAILKDFFIQAKMIQKMKPWQIIDETDVIELELPEEDENIYVSVIGREGISRAIIFYRGTEGLASYFDVLNQVEDSQQLAYKQSFTAIYFGEDSEFCTYDSAYLKRSGVSFKGEKEKPFVRVNEPGRMICPIEIIEMTELTDWLEILIRVLKYLQKNKQERAWLEKEQLLTVTLTMLGDLKYRFRPLAEVFSKGVEISVYINEIALAKAKKTLKKSADVWELGLFYLPTPIFEEGSEYLADFPHAFMAVDSSNELILGMHIAEDEVDERAFQLYFMDMIMELGMYPEKIHYQNEDVLKVLWPIVDSLNISVERKQTLPVLTGAYNELLDHLTKS